MISRDNWIGAFAQDLNSKTCLNTQISTGGGTAKPTSLDDALRGVIDPATGKVRVIVTI